MNIDSSSRNCRPLISIITVVYDGGANLEKTINSIINQKINNFEYIIIDGKSTDNTIDIIKKYQKHINYWLSETDEGIYDAMNKGISVANGQYIHFLNAGDLFYSKKVLLEVAKILESKRPAILIGGSVHVNHNENIQFYNPNIIKNTSSFYRKGKMICHQSMFYSINTFKKYGNYFSEYKIVADHDWMLRFLTKRSDKEEIIYIDIPIIYYNMEGVSAKNRRQVIMERNKIIDSHKLGALNLIFAKFHNKLELFKLLIITILKKLSIYKYYRKIKYS